MKFQLNIEIDEKEAHFTQKDAVNYVIESLADALEKTKAYYDIGCNVSTIINGLIS